MNKPPMKTAAEALEHLLSQAKPMAEVEVVSTQDALGRILAADILSQVDVPPMNNTQMDGYAVRVADIQSAGQSFILKMIQIIFCSDANVLFCKKIRNESNR